jgi:hypothetical protein
VKLFNVIGAVADPMILYFTKLLFLQRQNRIFGTYLGAYGATDAEILVDFNLLAIQIHGRTGQEVDTIPMVFALVVIHMKGLRLFELACCLCKKRAHLL